MNRKDVRRYAPTIVASVVVGVLIGLSIRGRKSDLIRTISPDIEKGVILPYEIIHELVDKGLGKGGYVMTIHENVDDVFDPNFILKFVGMTERVK